MSEIKVDKISGKTSVNAITVTGENGSTQTSLQQGLAKMWANCIPNTSPQQLSDSFNVTSLADGGDGISQFSFTNSMNNAVYSGLATIGSTNRFPVNDTPTTEILTIDIYSVSGQTANDTAMLNVSVHGDLA